MLNYYPKVRKDARINLLSRPMSMGSVARRTLSPSLLLKEEDTASPATSEAKESIGRGDTEH